jgi:hypothetical protein
MCGRAWLWRQGATQPDLPSMRVSVSAVPAIRTRRLLLLLSVGNTRLMRKRALPMSSQWSMKRCLASGFVFLSYDQLRVGHVRQRQRPCQLTQGAVLVGDVIASLLMAGFVSILVRHRSPSSTSTHKTLIANIPWLHIHTKKNTATCRYKYLPGHYMT